MCSSIRKPFTFINTNKSFSCIYKSLFVFMIHFLIFVNPAFTNIRKSFINTRK